MKYIVYKNSEVLHILDKAPVSVSNNLSVARCETIPTYNQANGEYLEVFNIQEHMETYTEKVEKEVLKVDEQGNEYTETEYEEVVKTRPYKTCELSVNQDIKVAKMNRIAELKNKLRAYDYIGVKIATGRATREEYASQIEEMTIWASEVDALEKELEV